jgi:methyl-accepting chemotaxis protein
VTAPPSNTGQITTAVGSLDASMGETLTGMQEIDRAASELHGTAERIAAVVREFRM